VRFADRVDGQGAVLLCLLQERLVTKLDDDSESVVELELKEEPLGVLSVLDATLFEAAADDLSVDAGVATVV